MTPSKRFGFITALGLAALALFCVPVAHADLLVTNTRGGIQPGNILRFDQATGAFIDAFALNAGVQPLDVTSGPDGHLYVTSGLSRSDDPSDPAAFSIRRYDGRTGAFIDVFVIGGLLNFPQGLVFGPDGHLYVGNHNPFSGANEVLRYDGRTGAFLDVFASTSSPSLFLSLGLAFGPDGHLYVAVSGNVAPGFGQVRRYDGKTGAFLDIFASDAGLRDARDLVFGPDGNLYVTSNLAGRVFRFDGTTGAFLDIFATLPAGGSQGLIFGPDGHLYVASHGPNQVVRFDGTTGSFLDVFIPPGTGGLDAPVSLFFTPPQVIFAGTPGTPNCHSRSVSALVHESGGLKAAASSMGFPSVQALQDAIRAFCD